MISTMVDYGERLRHAMGAAGVDTNTLAEHLGITYQAVKKVLDGKTKSLTAKNNALAAARLGVSPTYLATGKGSESPSAIESLAALRGIATEAGASGSRSPGKALLDVAAHLRSIPTEGRESIAQLASMMIRNGPSESIANVIDEISRAKAMEHAPALAKADRWRQDLTDVITSAPKADVAMRLRDLAAGLGLDDGQVEPRPPAPASGPDARPSKK